LTTGDVFIDVGASIGGYPIRLGTLGRVFAFEPAPRNFELLRSNVLNHLRTVDMLRACVCDRSGPVKLYVSNFHDRHSMVGQGEYLSVVGVTLDSVLGKLERPVQILKVDVDGSELFVLRGAEQTLRRCRFVVVENKEPAKSEIREFLMTRGFDYVTRHELNDMFVNVSNLQSP